MKLKSISVAVIFAVIVTVFPCSVFADEQQAEVSVLQDISEGNPEQSDEPAVCEGWFEDTSGNWMYYVDNEPVKGKKYIIDDCLYYFDENGFMQTGVVKIGKQLFYFAPDGKARTEKGWFDSKKKYALGDGVIASSIKKVDKKYYLFTVKLSCRVAKKAQTTPIGQF